MNDGKLAERVPGIPKKGGERCALCGERLDSQEAVEVEGGLLCEDCFSLYRGEEAICKRSAEFCEHHFDQYVDWWFSGDAFLDEEDRRSLLTRGYREWEKANPQDAREAREEFVRDSPGEWDDFLRGAE